MKDKALLRFFKKIAIPIVLVSVLWVIKIVENSLNLRFVRYGIYPREVDALSGIFTSPFIHSDFNHLISNSFPLLILISVMILFYRRVALFSLLLITLLTGLSVWMFARPSYHVGASGVVYGLVSFVFWSGIFRKNTKSIVLSLIVLMLYSGLFLGILPPEASNISWESHLAGGIVGIFVALLFKDVTEQDEKDIRYPWQDDESPAQYFLPRDVFEKTIAQRLKEEAERDAEEYFGH